MATSGNTSLSLTLNQLLEDAFDALQVGQEGETLNDNMYSRGKKALNRMLKAWQAQGIHLWTIEDGYLFLDKSVNEYPFSSAKVTNTYYSTTLDAAEVSGQTVLSVASTANMANGQSIGIIDENNDIHWSTIASFVTNDTVTINDALTTDSNSGAAVFYYTAGFNPVSRVLSVRRRDTSYNDVPVNFESKDYFDRLPNKTDTGTPVVAYYDRQETTGTMYVWPAASDASFVMPFTYERQIEIMSSATNTFDLPEYWYEAVIYNLARRLLVQYGASPGRAAEIKELAKDTLDLALSFDSTLYPVTVDMGR